MRFFRYSPAVAKGLKELLQLLYTISTFRLFVKKSTVVQEVRMRCMVYLLLRPIRQEI